MILPKSHSGGDRLAVQVSFRFNKMMGDGRFVRKQPVKSSLRSALAYYPLTFYFGILALLVASAFVVLVIQHQWQVDYRILVNWLGKHQTVLTIIATALLGVVLVSSAAAYRQTCQISQQEYLLWLQQRSTRTLFPFFIPLHDWLRLRLAIYRWWHSQVVAVPIHYLVLIVVTIFTGAQITTSLTGQTIVSSTPVIDHFAVYGFTSPTTAGDVHSITVEARDSFDNHMLNYGGTVTFSSDDAQADLPSNFTFDFFTDNGIHTFNNVSLKTAGTKSISVADTFFTSATGSQSGIVVNSAAASQLKLTGLTSPTTAGTAQSPTVTAKDPYNNTATGFTGTVIFSSTDNQATLPSNYSFTGGDAGIKIFSSGVVLKTAGSRSVSVASSGVTGDTTSGITVNPGALNHFDISLSHTAVKVGEQWSATVTAKDSAGNTTTSLPGGSNVSVTGSLSTDFYASGSYTAKVSSYTLSSGAVTIYGVARATGELIITVSNGGVSTDSPSLNVGSNSVSNSSFVKSPPIASTEDPTTDVNEDTSAAGPVVTPTTPVAIEAKTVVERVEEVIRIIAGSQPAVSLSILIGAATLTSGAISTAPVVTSFSSVFTTQVPFFQALLANLSLRRKRRKDWGTVSDQLTGNPIQGVFVELTDPKSNQTLKRAMTDRAGQYGFLVTKTGDYLIQISNPLYRPYRSHLVEVNNIDQPLSLDIGLAPNDKRLAKLARASRFIYSISVLDIIQAPILIAGSVLSIAMFIAEQNLLTSLLLTMYGLALIFRYGIVHRQRNFGVVFDKANKQPLANAVVQLTRETSTEQGRTFVQSTITDSRGRFLLLAEPGHYTITAAKEGYSPKDQPVRGRPEHLTLELSRS